MAHQNQSSSDRRPNDEQSAFEQAFEATDIARKFGAELTVAEQAADETGFFLVKRHETVDQGTFRAWLAQRIGGEEYMLLETTSGIFVVWMEFGAARQLQKSSQVALVGGVSVDINRLQKMLSPVDSSNN